MEVTGEEGNSAPTESRFVGHLECGFRALRESGGGSQAAGPENTFLLGTAGPRLWNAEPRVPYLGCVGAGVLAVQHERDPGSLHLPLEEVLLGNPDHLGQLAEQEEGFQAQ